MNEVCPQGHPTRETGRERVRETVEEVVYVVQKIKKFNREGSETLETVKIPEFVEKTSDVDVIHLACDTCGWSTTVREAVAAPTA